MLSLNLLVYSMYLMPKKPTPPKNVMNSKPFINFTCPRWAAVTAHAMVNDEAISTAVLVAPSLPVQEFRPVLKEFRVIRSGRRRTRRTSPRTTGIRWPRTATCPTCQPQIADLSCSSGVGAKARRRDHRGGQWRSCMALAADELQSIRQLGVKTASSLGPGMIQPLANMEAKFACPGVHPNACNRLESAMTESASPGRRSPKMTGMGWLEACRAAPRLLGRWCLFRPDVISAKLTWLQTVSHDRMGRHDIIHVDVIPHARSIGGGVIRPENRQMLPPPLHHIKQDLAQPNILA